MREATTTSTGPRHPHHSVGLGREKNAAAPDALLRCDALTARCYDVTTCLGLDVARRHRC